MCLRPINIRSPARVLHKYGGQLLNLKVKCGKCAECVNLLRQEWAFRSEQQVRETLDKGGYIYFDTLTYDNENLPKLSDTIDIDKYGIKDHSCFSHEHFKLFLKNLRRQLQYHHGNNEFKYFLTSEYGTDERKTHRPHYHIMFYITNGINPLTFSKLVSKCWHYGRTDGLPYKSIRYVAKHVYGYDLGFGNNVDTPTIQKLCNYVSKYITKSSKFRAKLDKRINVLKQHIEDDLELNSIIRNVDMFHRQSQQFGIYYLSNLSQLQLDALEDDKILIKDSKKVVKSYPLPMYYKRKLYYNIKKRDDDTYYWEFNEKGINHKIKHILHDVDKIKTKYQDLIDSLPKDKQEVFYHLLGNRYLNDYIIYKQFYEGRMRDYSSYDDINFVPQYGLTDTEYNLYDWLNIYSESTLNNSLQDHYLYHVDIDNNIVDVVEDKVSFDDDIKKKFDKNIFFDLISFNENSCPEFKDFDKITSLLDSCRDCIKQNQQTLHDYKEDLKEKFKNLKF